MLSIPVSITDLVCKPNTKYQNKFTKAQSPKYLSHAIGEIIFSLTDCEINL